MFNRTRDPVCGMKVQKNDSKATAEYEGETYYFCSTSCRDTFIENPEEYTTGDEKQNRPMDKAHCSCCNH